MGRLQAIVQFVIFSIFLTFITICNARRLDVEEVTKRQLDTLIKTEDYLAVFWCKYNQIKANIHHLKDGKYTYNL